MKIKTTLAVIALMLSPTLALAEGGCAHGKSNISASACAEGSLYDAATGTCQPVTSS